MPSAAEINPNIIKEINNLQDFIKEGNYQEFYRCFKVNIRGKTGETWYSTGKVTQMFYDAGILDEVMSTMYFIPQYMFFETNIPKVVVPSNIQTIETSGFAYCQAEEIILPDTLRVINNNAFAYCRNLKEIKIPESIKAFSTDSTFWKCDSVLRFWIPEKFRGRINKEDLCGSDVIGGIKYY